MSGLELQHLGVTYPGARSTPALHSVDLLVPRGEVLVVTGPSGSGKSSLLGAIAGVIPSSGRVLWDDADVAHVPTHARQFGLMFQEGALFPHRSVARNVSFGLEMARWSRQAIRTRVDALLEAMGIAHLRERAPAELSGGERQRVALARALAPRPRLLLLDEPLNALDGELRARLALEIRQALLDSGTTAIYVTHDGAEGRAVGTLHATVSGGRLVSEPR